jgi:hypothetical protein
VFNLILQTLLFLGAGDEADMRRKNNTIFIPSLYQPFFIDYNGKKGGNTMPMSIEEILSEAQVPPNESKAMLAEKLIASIEEKIDPQVTKIHLQEVKKRRDEIRSGKVKPISGEEGLAKVRAIIEQ